MKLGKIFKDNFINPQKMKKGRLSEILYTKKKQDRKEP